jgi:hypothetical protein
MEVEREFYDALVALRRSGYRCPSGKVYAPSGDLAFDCRLWRAAVSYSKAMAEEGFFAHTTPSGQGPCEYSSAFGLQACGQNLAGGQRDAQSVLSAWLNSPDHCDSMMSPEANRMGLGLHVSEASAYTYYWTLFLDHDACPVDRSCSPPGEYAQPPACDACRDLNLKGCRAYQGYAGSIYCHAPWPANQCRMTCGHCRRTSCEDRHETCRSYEGYAGSSYCDVAWADGWAVENCPKTCKLC